MVEAARWTEIIQRAHECIDGRFRRPELCRLLSPVERKNDWQPVEQTGDTYPPGVQRVLSTPAFAGGPTSGMPGWLTTVSGTMFWIIWMPPTATDGGRDRLPSVSRGQVLKTGNRSVRVKRYYSGAAVWLQPVGAHIASCRDVDGDLSGPRAAAHRRPTLGSRRRLR